MHRDAIQEGQANKRHQVSSMGTKYRCCVAIWSHMQYRILPGTTL